MAKCNLILTIAYLNYKQRYQESDNGNLNNMLKY